jgi:hypothetical protein
MAEPNIVKAADVNAVFIPVIIICFKWTIAVITVFSIIRRE